MAGMNFLEEKEEEEGSDGSSGLGKGEVGFEARFTNLFFFGSRLGKMRIELAL